MTLSNIDLLVDFICVKLKKLESAVSWDSLGYDVQNFTMPLKSQMKSNFLKYEAPKRESKEVEKSEVEVEEKDKQEKDKEKEIVKEEEELQKKIEREKGK